MKNSITVIHHSADYDGIFSREIARKFLPTDTTFIGWDFKDKPIQPIPEGTIYIIDLPVDAVFGFKFTTADLSPSGMIGAERMQSFLSRLIWIDHHRSSIRFHPSSIPGYRLEGVAACRLAWQWFTATTDQLADMALPEKQTYVLREVDEPYAVTLAGEYDIWDHAKSNHDDEAFQFGLDSQFEGIHWDLLLHDGAPASAYISKIVEAGKLAQQCYKTRDAKILTERSFMRKWKGLNFLILNTARASSGTFAALDKPETGHDALMAFYYDGSIFHVSMYHAAHRKDIDLSVIAVECGKDEGMGRFGGGGHPGACGFKSKFFPPSSHGT